MTSETSSSSQWKTTIVNEWRARRLAETKDVSVLFPLAMNPFGEDEILAMTDVLLTGRLTLGKQIEHAEKKFAEIVGVPYAVMVNSGSSANLLSVSAIANKLRAKHCQAGDHVLIPAVSWSTSVFPLIQHGLRPIFVDVDPRTFNISIYELERKLTNRVKAVMAVHVLGNSTNMKLLMEFVRRHELLLIEDTCESLGSYCLIDENSQRKIGEGGMITCHTEDDYNFLRCLRAHGWTRHLTNRQQIEDLYPDIDCRFLFVNMGYNLRPLEVQGAMLSVQLDKLDEFNRHRRENFRLIRESLSRDERFSSLMSLMEASEGIDPAWFGLAFLLHRPYTHQRCEFLKYLEKNGIENRPIISGNFIRQPCISTFCEEEHPENYPGAEVIHSRGFFVGVHQIPLDQAVIKQLVDIMLAFPFSPYHFTLVTGSNGMLGRYIRDVVSEQSSSTEILDSKPQKIRTKDSEWIFATREDGDLRRVEDVQYIFKRYQPTRVIHCAARLASFQQMSAKPVEYWFDNVTMNNNILKTAYEFQTWIGQIKLVSILSTVMFPKDAQFPIDTSSIYNGSPHPASESYAYAKRSLAQLTQWYRTEYHCNFVSILPCNFFGAYGDFNPRTAPLVNALIAKIENQNPSIPLQMMGTGQPLRQIMFAEDLARIILWSLENYSEDQPLIVAGEEVSISQLVQLIAQQMNYQGVIH
ncbi:unnamed protein product [Adineta ricciae]|uniref:NAD-dependent epimerase/dehydratase domain-containing protein n=1 Tax=Adineta ricciae TaxID=249248 RepID=A0A814S1R5_ADIRI|nr:unnamed protein product [Adineta ricciae]